VPAPVSLLFLSGIHSHEQIIFTLIIIVVFLVTGATWCLMILEQKGRGVLAGLNAFLAAGAIYLFVTGRPLDPAYPIITGLLAFALAIEVAATILALKQQR
jgi:hypothetical protein